MKDKQRLADEFSEQDDIIPEGARRLTKERIDELCSIHGENRRKSFEALRPFETHARAKAIGSKGGKNREKNLTRRYSLKHMLRVAEHRTNIDEGMKADLRAAGFAEDELNGLAVEARSLQWRAEQGNIKAIMAKEQLMGRLTVREEHHVELTEMIPLIDLTRVPHSISQKKRIIQKRKGSGYDYSED